MNEEDYYVAELVEAAWGDTAELSTEKREQVAELQKHYQTIDVEEHLAEGHELDDEEKKMLRVVLAEFKRLGAEKGADATLSELEDMGVDVAELEERFDV